MVSNAGALSAFGSWTDCDIEAHVIHGSSVAVSREHWRAPRPIGSTPSCSNAPFSAGCVASGAMQDGGDPAIKDEDASNRTGGAPSSPDLEKEIEVSNIAQSSLDESSSIFGTIIVGVHNMFIEGQKRWWTRNRGRS
jgi:hypothetical protein